MRRRTDPRSPVQSVKNPSLLPLLAVLVIAGAAWGWDQRDMLIDWYDGELTPREAGPRKAKANLAALFSADDYPNAAIRREEQGTVAFRLLINRRGYVADCQVTASSGSDTLDEQTCDILESRARFEPARDASGQRVPDETSGRIRWELPDA